MEDGNYVEGASSSQNSSEERSVELNIKTLDSRVHTFRVNTNMRIFALKEKVASSIGVPVGQQRLIFRGRVLKDDHLLSEYNVEDGHTLHLVERQPVQAQTASRTSTGPTNEDRNNNSSVSDPPPAGPRGRVGQVSHSVVLGTFNIGGDQGESIVPDLSRVIGAVLNSVGMGNLTTAGGPSSSSSSTASSSSNVQANQEPEAGGMRGPAGNGVQTGNMVQMGHGFFNLPFQTLQSSLQIPLAGASMSGPSQIMAIPDSLTTLSEFIYRMEMILWQASGRTQSLAPPSRDPPRPNAASVIGGMPTSEALITVLRRAHQLLNNHVESALSNFAGHIERDGRSDDPSVRSEIQGEAANLSIAMQHLGALFLELGRTIMTLRMGPSPAEFALNTGPAVYISPAGPNPIMVQPFPSQTTSLFAGVNPTPSLANAGIPAAVGLGDIPRNVSIHIHAGTSVASTLSSLGTRATTGDTTSNQGQTNGNGGVTPRDLPARSVVAGVPVPSPAEAGGHVLSVLHPLNASSQSENLNSTLSSSRQVLSPSVSSGSQHEMSDSVVQQILPSASSPIDGSGQAHVSGNDGSENFSSSIPQIPNGLQESSTGSRVDEDERNERVDGLVTGSVHVGDPPSCVSSLPEADVHAVSEGGKSGRSGQQFGRDEDAKATLCTEQTPSTSLVEEQVDPASSTFNALPAEKIVPGASGSSKVQQSQGGEKMVPLGLGSGGLQQKKKNRPAKSELKDGGSAPSGSNQSLQSVAQGQRALQSHASLRSNADEGNAHESSRLPSALRQIMDGSPMGAQIRSDGVDAGNVMSQVINSPGINSILEGMSQQAGFPSPAGLRGILQQVTQNPSMRNALNQITQQVGQGQGFESMFSGSGREQGGRFDLSRMVQQMMPIVSQALGGALTGSTLESELGSTGDDNRPETSVKLDEKNCQVDVHGAIQRIENHDPPVDVFRAVVECANNVDDETSVSQEVIDDLCSDEELQKEYMEMLEHDIAVRVYKESSSSRGSS